MSAREEAIRRVLQEGVSEQAVSHDLGIKNETLSSWIKQAQAVQLVVAGQSQAEVARALGIPPQTLSRWVINARAQNSRPRRGTTDGGARPTELRLACTTFGVLMAKLRRERAAVEGGVPTIDEFARRLGVSSGTLRNLESAQKAPPQTTLAYPLSVECGLFLPMAFLVIGFVRAFDESDSIEMAREVAREMRRTEPRLGFFVDHLHVALDLLPKERREHLKKTSVIDKLTQLMRSQPASASPQNSAPAMLLGQVSPVLVDAVMALSEKLHFFHPALDEAALGTWEDVNSQRIRRVFAYYSDPGTLLKTIDAFPCKFLHLSSAPVKYLIVLNGPRPQDVGTIKEKFLQKSPGLPEKSIVVHEVEKNSDIAKAFSEALRYDVSESRIVDFDGPHIVRMTTLNLYELDMNRHDGTSFGQLHCAFIDNSVCNGNRTGAGNPSTSMYFARALRSFDIDRVLPLFRKVASAYGVDL